MKAVGEINTRHPTNIEYDLMNVDSGQLGSLYCHAGLGLLPSGKCRNCYDQDKKETSHLETSACKVSRAYTTNC